MSQEEFIIEHTKALQANTQAMQELIAKLDKPDTPLDNTLWGAAKCAGYFEVSVIHFKTRIAVVPNFPMSANLETINGKMNPKWKASEVVEWAMAHWDKKDIKRKARG